MAAVLLLSAGPAHAQDAANPYGDGQSDEVAEASYQDAASTVIPADAPIQVGEDEDDAGVRYVVIDLPGPCFNDQQEVSTLAGIEARPPGELVYTFCRGDLGPQAVPQPDFAQIRSTAVSLATSVRPARPRLAVQPRGSALVRQAAVFSVADPGAPPSATDTSGAFTIRLTLTQPSYEWDFGGGRWEAGGRGQRYAGGVVPQAGRGNPYVTHTWSTAGQHRVSVRAVYAVSYRVTGPGIDRTFTLPAIRPTSTAAVQVVQARSELVRE